MPLPKTLPQPNGRRIIVASNRGPVSFVREESGEVVAKRGIGGLVTALGAALQLSGGLWIASAMSEEDRKQVVTGRLSEAAGEAHHDLRYLSFDPELYDRFYNGISNRILWFLHHLLWDIPRAPRFDEATREAWEAYVRVNRAFAEAMADEGQDSDQAVYLVQDYHLSLVPAMLRELRPGASIAHFSHIPFADAGYLRVLPAPIRGALVEGLLGADVVGFQASAWAWNFLRVCQASTNARVDFRHQAIHWQGRRVHVGVYPISIDVESIRKAAVGDEIVQAARKLLRWRGDRKFVLRVDRAELSKNIVRGFDAYETFLRDRPEWRGRVVFLAHLNPSRTDIPEYRAYLRECRVAARRINARFGRRGWQPVRLSVMDDVAITLAAYTMYDALLVNPVFDGMNLVAKEGPALNERDGVLILSENAGAFEELGKHALAVNPFDVAQTAQAIAAALEMDQGERARRATALREAVERSRLDRWVQAQLEDLQLARSA
ncbi:MAG TPA: trehalose-6-phosphate synthase [Actinomycetota bacterium]|jgi:trehalose 6-phosphate synthase|nr:trehalose-6-phosphate synthase [Actinomycetota bacterium]